MELGEMCVDRQGWTPQCAWICTSQHRDEDQLGGGKPLEHPLSAFRGGERAAGCSPHGTDLGVLCLPPHSTAGPDFWLGFEAPLTFAISSQPCPPLRSVTEVLLASGDAELQ